MIHVLTSRRARIVSTVALALALVSIVAGCGGNAASTTPTTGTAKDGLSMAKSALSTTAPDAKLLVVQTEEAVTPTTTPVWSYLFGSPKDDKTYVVYVTEGKVMSTSEYGTAGLSQTEWSAVPSADSWKIDSDEAHKKAAAAAGAKAEDAYTMGFLTYIPSSETSDTAVAFVWYVSFDPATSSATTGTVEVDAKTGAVLTK
jgi:hypothetical protein